MMWIILYGIHENMSVSELAFANQRDAQIHAEELINTLKCRKNTAQHIMNCVVYM